jgi:hypothetical protein
VWRGTTFGPTSTRRAGAPRADRQGLERARYRAPHDRRRQVREAGMDRPEAGWYQDPEQPDQARYFDGYAGTEHTGATAPTERGQKPRRCDTGRIARSGAAASRRSRHVETEPGHLAEDQRDAPHQFPRNGFYLSRHVQVHHHGHPGRGQRHPGQAPVRGL